MSVRIILAACVALFGGLLVGAYFNATSGGPLPKNEPRSDEWAQQLRRWNNVVERLGPEKAYMEFIEAEKGRTQQEQHLDAHAFGQAIYDAVGLEALAVSDERFSYGCFHQIIGVALAESGTSIIPETFEACEASLGERWRACTHSIGHGLLSFSGYDMPDIARALELCDELPSDRPIPECYRGVFMEYNFQAMLGEEAKTRTLPPDDVMYPCLALSGTGSRACIYGQSQLWRNTEMASGADDTVIFRRLGARCESLKNDLKTTCFQGIGTTIAWDTDYDVPERARLCDAATDAMHERLECRSHLAYWLTRILRTESDETYAPSDACRGLPVGEERACLEFTAS